MGNSFKNVSVILPVINETVSLQKTIEIIEADSSSNVLEYILVVCEKTIPESLRICENLNKKSPHRFIVCHQKLPYLGGAVRDSLEIIKGSHTIMMSSDLETDPANVKNLICEARKHEDAIITASRWIEKGSFANYNKVKLVCNYIFQKLFSILFKTKLSDMTYGYRIFPSSLLKAIEWEELRHPFLLETVIKPLKLGIEVYEIPSKWIARIEGESQNTFFKNFAYFGIGFKVLFRSKNGILKQHFQLARH